MRTVTMTGVPAAPSHLKIRATRVLVGVSIALFCIQLLALYTLAATFAAGLAWWASALVLLGPPVALTTLVLSLRAPRQLGACVASSFVIISHAVIWTWLLSHMTWQPHR
jgi:hypothetical protein